MLHLLVPGNACDLRCSACARCSWTLQSKTNNHSATCTCCDRWMVHRHCWLTLLAGRDEQPNPKRSSAAFNQDQMINASGLLIVHFSHAKASASPVGPTLRAGYREGCAGLATSQMQSSPSAAPDASRLGLKLLNSKPLTCETETWNEPSLCAVGLQEPACNTNCLQLLGFCRSPCPSASAAWTTEGSALTHPPVGLGSRGRWCHQIDLQQ